MVCDCEVGERFTEPALMIRLGHGDRGMDRRRAYHTAAHQSEKPLCRWARDILDREAGFPELLKPPEPEAEYCDE